MNTALTFLKNNRERLDLKRYGIGGEITSIVLTPRFHASSHVVFLVLPKGSPYPLLVAKVPRLIGSNGGIEREAVNLRAVQSLRPGGFNSIPKVIAFEEYCARPILVETALIGQPMTPAMVRRDLVRCCGAATAWLTDVQQPGGDIVIDDPQWFARLVERPLHDLTEFFRESGEEGELLAKTWEFTVPLHGMNLPLVFEHGDLAHPNIMLLKDGGLGVLDWELAEPRGLPASDLFFFLTYATFALRNAHRNNEYLWAFQKAFFGREGWARPFVWDYIHRLGLSPQLLTPLFVLCWARYVSSLLFRLHDSGQGQDLHSAVEAKWLRANRYFVLWQYTVEHVNELDWDRLPQERDEHWSH